jgi:hypothetical protein
VRKRPIRRQRKGEERNLRVVVDAVALGPVVLGVEVCCSGGRRGGGEERDDNEQPRPRLHC